MSGTTNTEAQLKDSEGNVLIAQYFDPVLTRFRSSGASPNVAISTPGAAALGLYAQITPYGRSKVSVEPTGLFIEPFDGPTVDIVNRWNLSGTNIPTQANGQFTLNGGTTANATSVAISQPTFSPPGLGFLAYASTITLNPTKVLNHNTHYFFGRGTVTSYAIGMPMTDGFGFEVDITGELCAVAWIGGTRYVINSTNAALITAQGSLPTGGFSTTFGTTMNWPTAGPHLYFAEDRGDSVFFFIDGLDTPIGYAKNVQPNVQALPLRVAKINAAASVVASQFVSGGVVLGDSSSQNNTNSDPTFPWRRQVVGANGGASVTSPSKLANTYSCSFNVVAAAAATDISVISGSATTTVYVTKVIISGTQTTAGLTDTSLVKRSTADTGGTSTAQGSLQHDSSDVVASAIVLAYTANPAALGTAAGTVRRGYLPIAGATSVVNPIVVFEFGDKGKEIILRGVAQQLAVNLNGATLAGGTFDINIEWFEV